MNWSKSVVLAAFVLVLCLPFLVRLSGGAQGHAPSAPPGTRRLIVVTPHVEQIRFEFGGAFAKWHERTYGEAVAIDWRAPGGTKEIAKQLEAQLVSTLQSGRFTVSPASPLKSPDRDKEVVTTEVVPAQGTMGYDVMIGGGTYEHGKLKQGMLETVTIDGKATKIRARIAAPAGFAPADLEKLFGENLIGAGSLYDPDQYWIGTALSCFGVMYNREVLKELGITREPESFADLADPRYVGMLALADPRQSGSVATTFEAILNDKDWDEGWRLLRQIAANARYFSGIATRPPVDVSTGDAAAGLVIDFYGRTQAQSVLKPGEDIRAGRLGYVDPKGEVFVDPDPVSIIAGGPNPDLARRFVEFCLSEEAQALWQFPSKRNPLSAGNPKVDGGKSGPVDAGPLMYELRRMPVRRVMFQRYLDAFVDHADPFALASPTKPRGWRDAIAPLMASFGIDTSDALKDAWRALSAARADSSFPRERLAEMETLFFAMPDHVMADGRTLPLNKENYKAISDDTKRWSDPVRGPAARIAYSAFFTKNYRSVVTLFEQSVASR